MNLDEYISREYGFKTLKDYLMSKSFPYQQGVSEKACADAILEVLTKLTQSTTTGKGPQDDIKA